MMPGIRTKSLMMALCILCPAKAGAQPADPKMTIELASNRVDITTGFNGAQIVLFGTTDIKNAALAVTLKGPERTIIVRRKDKVMGAWLNRQSVEYRRAPTYYDYALYQTADLNFSPDLLQQNQIGAENLSFYSEEEEDANTEQQFRDSLIRDLQKKGFYPVKPLPVQFPSPGFFKVTFSLPPGVPTGLYTVEAYLMDGRGALYKQSQRLQVAQVGFNASVYSYATEHSFAYGLFCIVLAMTIGWSAFTFLRRD